MRYMADDIAKWDVHVCVKGRWVLARSVNHRFEPWRERVKNAWAVLVGRADALTWEERHD